MLSGPSGVGKGTLAAEVRRRRPDVWISVSVTTRRPRPGEVDGVHYAFVSDETFDSFVADGDLLEWAQVHGLHRSGTPRRAVAEVLEQGRPALLEIDLQGARQVRAVMPEALSVFLAPPSWDELVRRLTGRGTEPPQERERRLQTARQELLAEAEFDVTVVNDDLELAADRLVALMASA